MGETTSGWNVPLHSSDSEHHWMKIREEKGKGGALRINRGDTGGPLPATMAGDPTNAIKGPGSKASSVLTNPFDKSST